MDERKVATLKEGVYLHFLEEAINEGKSEGWLQSVMMNFSGYFCPLQYRGKNIEQVLANASVEDLVCDFVRDCPDDIHSFYRDSQQNWMAQQLVPFSQRDNQVIECVKATLTLDAIERYLQDFETGYILGSGRKPGKSFLIRYIEKVVNIQVEVSTYNPTKWEVIVFPNEQNYRIGIPVEICNLMKVLGVPDSVKDIQFMQDFKSRVTCADVCAALAAIQ